MLFSPDEELSKHSLPFQIFFFLTHRSALITYQYQMPLMTVIILEKLFSNIVRFRIHFHKLF